MNRRTCLYLLVLLASAAGLFHGFAEDGRAPLQFLAALHRRMAMSFTVVNTSTPILNLLLPTIISGSVVYAVMRLSPPHAPWSRVFVILVLVVLYTAYMLFRFSATLNFSNVTNGIFSVGFFLAELLIYLKSLSANFQMFWLTDRSPQATRLSALVSSGRYLPNVDIFLPTYSEPVEMLRRTILGCQSLRYSRKEIYLLDDQRRPAMRALALELGCRYRDRPDNRHAKAGNMNAALPVCRGELIAVFDADFIPTEDFLERTVGFFSDPEVGLVQTPQNFYSVDAVARNLGLPNVITEEQQVFFRAAQPGRDTMGAMICHGTSFVIRRSALEAIGWFPGETLSEDWATSIKLQSAGYKTYYLNELLSAGIAAEFTSEFVTQRLRWARGTLQCFAASTNPLTVPGLSFLQRLAHLCGPLHYIPFVCRFYCLLLPLLFFFFGVVPLRTSAEMLVFFFLPYWFCQAISLSWLTGGHRSAFWSEVYETMLCVPMSLTVVSTLLRPFGKPFKVSKKGETKAGLTFNPIVGGPLLVLLCLYVPTLIYACANAVWYPSPGIFSIAVGWSVYSIVLLWLSLQASLDIPQPSKAIRFEHFLAGRIRFQGAAFAVATAQVSDTEILLQPGEDLSKLIPVCAPRSAGLFLTLADCGLQEAPIERIEPLPDGKVLVQLGKLPLDQHRSLIRFLYCRPGQWNDLGVSEPVTLWHFIEAVFRMFPLAET